MAKFSELPAITASQVDGDEYLALTDDPGSAPTSVRIIVDELLKRLNVAGMDALASVAPATDQLAVADADDSNKTKRATVNAVVAAVIAAYADEASPAATAKLLTDDAKKSTLTQAVQAVLNAAAAAASPGPTDKVLMTSGETATLAQVASQGGNAEYGQIYGCPGAGQTTNVGPTYAAIPAAAYDTDGLSSANVAPDQANGRITVNATGTYRFTFHALFRRFALITDIDVALFEVNGGTEITSVRACDLRMDSEAEAVTIGGLVSVTAGEVYEVRAKRTSGSNTIETWYASLIAERVAA